MRKKGARDGISDTPRTTDDQHYATGEIQFMHLRGPFHRKGCLQSFLLRHMAEKHHTLPRHAPMNQRRPGRTDTRERIKAAAQRLIAEHGVDGVSVRDIVRAAGQQNMASLHYYFRTKEQLIKELVIDAAVLMEGRRAQVLSHLEQSGQTPTLRDIVEILVHGAALDPAKSERNGTVMRFLSAVVGTHRHLYEEAIGDTYNRTYQQCLALVRQCLPRVPPAALNQRLLFVSLCSFNLLVAREAGIMSGRHARSYWQSSTTLTSIIDFCCAGLAAPTVVKDAPKVSARKPDQRPSISSRTAPLL